MSREGTVTVLLVIVGLLKFTPVVGLLGAARLDSLYGFGTLEGDLLTLMQHRALLFGILGGFILYSVFRRHLQPAAMLMAAVSLLGFILLVWLAGAPGEKVYRVAVIDLVALLPLALAMILYWRK